MGKPDINLMMEKKCLIQENWDKKLWRKKVLFGNVPQQHKQQPSTGLTTIADPQDKNKNNEASKY